MAGVLFGLLMFGSLISFAGIYYGVVFGCDRESDGFMGFIITLIGIGIMTIPLFF